MYFLDTNTIIYFLNGKYEKVREKIFSLPPIEIAIPVVVKAELVLGAYKSNSPERTLENIERFFEPFEIIAFTDLVTYEYAKIRNELEKSGNVIGPNDLIIAALTKFHDATLVTNNEKEFSRITGLNLENWIK